MKKKILISLLIVSFFNYVGCYSYYTLTEEEIIEGMPNPDDDIKLVLNDDSEIEFGTPTNHISNDGYYLKVDNASNYLIGEGDIINRTTGVKSNFEGIVKGEMIDSSRNFNVDTKQYSVFWTKDQARLSFEKGNFVEMTPEQGAGYFVFKPPDSVRKISFDQIKEIQVDKFDSLNTGLLVAAILGVLVALTIPFWGERSIAFE
jgi:hypothetical protein